MSLSGLSNVKMKMAIATPMFWMPAGTVFYEYEYTRISENFAIRKINIFKNKSTERLILDAHQSQLQQ